MRFSPSTKATMKWIKSALKKHSKILSRIEKNLKHSSTTDHQREISDQHQAFKDSIPQLQEDEYKGMEINLKL